jgi:hypothetical protein
LAHILVGEPVTTPHHVRGRLSPEYARARADLARPCILRLTEGRMAGHRELP